MSEKKKKKDEEREAKKGFSIGALFYNNKFVAVFSVLTALVLWFSMAFTNTEEFPVAIRDVPVTIKIPEAAQADGLKVRGENLPGHPFGHQTGLCDGL